MHANYISSLLVSLILHAFAAALIFLSTLYMARQVRDQPVIFELVAGPATAPDELVAPALGNTTAKIKLEVPKVELIATMPEPEPVVQTRPEERTKPDTSIAKEMKQAQRMSYKDYLKKHPTPKQTAPVQPRLVANVPHILVANASVPGK